jgi:RNA polymerase sigma factor (TIGR02999 family)
MRQVLVDHARNRGRQKRGSAARPVTLRETHAVFHRDVSVDALNEALGRLEALSPQQGRIVEKRFFAGMTIPEIGDALSIPPESVKRDWAMARAWLHHALRSV